MYSVEVKYFLSKPWGTFAEFLYSSTDYLIQHQNDMNAPAAFPREIFLVTRSTLYVLHRR